jgi:hypothetical protein
MSDKSRATEQLEKISRAIRELEGFPVDFRLARKLSELQRMIADMHPLPVAPNLPEAVSPTEKLVTCKGQPEPHIRIHACREPIVEVSPEPTKEKT